MATASTWLARSRVVLHSPGRASPPPKPRAPGLLGRIGRGLGEYRRRRAERAAADLIERNGAHLTDAVEREIGNRALVA